MKRILVLLADGFEEIEALTPVDYLRRAGAEVVAAGVTGNVITGSHKIKVTADILLKDIPHSELDSYDMIIVPGGMKGSLNLAASDEVSALLTEAFKNKKIIAAICAAPVVVLAKLGLLKNAAYTCYPEMETEIPSYAGKNYESLTEGAQHTLQRVESSGNIITSRGAGCAEEFALTLVETLFGTNERKKLQNGIVAR